MTTYEHFVGLPIQLKLEIIKKCYPIPYVRLRRSCRFLDELCEKNRRRLGIYPYQRCSELYLLNSFNRSISQPITFTISETTKQKVLDTPHIVINYGRSNGIPGFLVPMTKENIPQIRRSLSGFAFTRITIKNWAANRIKKQEFGEAVVHFLEVAGEFHIQYLGISGVTASEVETIVTTWKTVKSAYFNCSAECWDVLKLDCIQGLLRIEQKKITRRPARQGRFYSRKYGISCSPMSCSAPSTQKRMKVDVEVDQNIKQLLFTFYQWSSQPIICQRTIQELALDREVVRFFATHLDRSATRSALENIVASWKDGIFPTTFCFAFSDPRRYYDETNIYNEWNRLMPTNALYLGNYIEQAQNKKEESPQLNCSIQPVKFDIWINERPDDNIFQLFYITRRIYEETWCETDYHLLTQISKDKLIILLIEYIFDHVHVNCPVDYSGLYEEMCSVDSLTGNRGTFPRLLDTFYKKINRRTRSRQSPKRHWDGYCIMMPGDHHPPPTSIRQPFSSLAPAQHMQSHREQHRCRQVLLSVTVVVCVAITWALHTQFAQIALHINKEKFNAPYVLMWFNTCFMIFCYPIYLLVNLIRGEKIGETHQHASLLFGDRGFCLMSVLCKVTPFLLFWIAANYTYAKALVHVSASIATSISACNAAEVYILSIWILHDKFVPFKLLSVVFAIAGVAVISLGVYGAANLQWLGILLSILSATSAAFYKVLFKRVVGNADLSQVSLMMTCLGLLNLTLNFPPAIILPLTGVELFSWNGIPWIPLIGAGCLSLLFNFSINFGIAMLHPLVISVGMLIGIPLNASIDILFRSVPITASFVGGTVLICISFILIIFPYEMFRNGTKSIPAEESLPRAESI